MGDIKLGPPSSLITINPSYGAELTETMVNRQDLRTKEAALFTYIENGRFNEFRFPLTWVTSSERSLVNSWWVTALNLELQLDSDFPSSKFDVRIMGGEEPFQRHHRPYFRTFYRGEVILQEI